MRSTSLIALIFVGIGADIGISVANASSAAVAEDIGNEIDIYRLSAYYGEDASSALQASGDWALSSATRINVDGAYVHAQGSNDTLNSYQVASAIDHRIGNWGVALELNYRDDDSTVTTAGASGRGYYRTDQGSVGLTLGRRRIDVSYRLPPRLRPFVPDSQSTFSNEYGLDLRYSLGAFALYANGTDYQYDDAPANLGARFDRSRLPIAQLPELQQRLAAVRQKLLKLNFASLRLATNLLDYSVVAGTDYQFGEQLFNVEVAHEQVQIDSIVIDSVDVGWTFPIGRTMDMEVRVGSAHVEHADSLLYGSINFSFYR
jgi:hypothetical protein